MERHERARSVVLFGHCLTCFSFEDVNQVNKVKLFLFCVHAVMCMLELNVTLECM
jgi:hypothetical protein